jgi:hypothetical protein
LENISENNESQKPSQLENQPVPVRGIGVRFPYWLKNKYLITGVVFVIWICFIDRNDLPTQWKRVMELRTLQQSEKNMDSQISDTKQELELLKTNPSTLEKYAREKYKMKRDNEDLYIISATKQ